MWRRPDLKAGIIGAAGLTGRELLEILSEHPSLEISHITSDRHAGQHVSEVFPALEGKMDLTFKRHEDPIERNLPLFLAVPNETSLAVVPELLEKGHRVVDLSGAFRLNDQDAFEKYYKLKHTAFSLMKESVFGMPELFRENIKKARLVANPGCYPTSVILPLSLLAGYFDQIAAISADSKSGVSGAGGRTEDAGFSFNSVYENFRAYKILRHQHEPEIREYALGKNHAANIPFVFTPHLLPVFRGILSTITIFWKENAPIDLTQKAGSAAVKEPFLRFLKEPEDVQLSRVQKTNFADISLRSEKNTTVMVSAIDNLVKGAAGQAVQNMNLMLGLTETDGLLKSKGS